jgi:hypothetical protein
MSQEQSSARSGFTIFAVGALSGVLRVNCFISARLG